MSSWEDDLREAVRQLVGPDPYHGSITDCLERAAESGALDERSAEVMSILEPLVQLPSGRNGDQVDQVVHWLARNGRVELLARFTASPRVDTVRRAFEDLAELGASGREALLRAIEMRKDPDEDLPASSVRAALRAGAAPSEVLRALLRSPSPAAMLYPARMVLEILPAADARRIFLEVPLPDRERALEVMAQDLAHHAIRDLAFATEGLRGRHPDTAVELGDWADAIIVSEHLTRATADPSFIRRVALWAEQERRRFEREKPAWMPLPPRLNVTDYRPVLGLALREPLAFEEVEIVRFDYLRTQARIEGEPVEWFLQKVVPHYGELEEEQHAWDETRDALATVEQALARARFRLEATEREGDEEIRRREPIFFVPAHEEEDGDGAAGAVERLGRLAVELRNQAEGPQFERLREASAHVVEALSERPVTWARVEPEALLGEFQPFTRTVTIYPAMIRLLAGHPELRRVASRDELINGLSEIALLHEAAHGYVVLGESCDELFWRDYRSAPYRLHEALATACTERMVEWLGDPRLRRIWEALRKLLPEEYQGAEDLLQAMSGEELRRAILRARRPYAVPSAYGRVPGLFDVVDVGAGELARRLGRDGYDALRSRIDGALERIRRTQPDLAGAAYAELFQALGTIPTDVGQDLASRRRIKWPSWRKLRKWERAALHDGPPVGTSALRLRLEWIDDGPGVSAVAGEGDRHNVPAIGLPSFDDLVGSGSRVVTVKR